MSRVYITDISQIADRGDKEPKERLPKRAAILGIAALSLLFWSPILLPFAALLHW